MSKLIICPNEFKMDYLNRNNDSNELINIKFMNIKEFMDNYFFSYDDRAIYYLMDKYDYNLDVCRVYLGNLYPIDINKNYNSSKLNFLKDLKIELINNNLLYFNDGFREYLKDVDIEVYNYYELDKYVIDAIGCDCSIPDVDLNIKVVKCNNIEDEVNDVCLKIINLLNSGVSINNIFLANVSEEYLYVIDKLFSYYNIPINLDMNTSIYSTLIVKNYLDTGNINLENVDSNGITRKLVNVINSLAYIDSGSSIYKKLLIDKLKSCKISDKKLSNAVNVCNLFDSKFSDSDYLFVLGFNQDVLPVSNKDILFIDDSIRDEVNMFNTTYLNVRGKNVLKYILSNIKNLNISYKLNSPFSSYYKSSMIGDLKLEEVSPIIDNFNYSDIYNKLRLGEDYDTYYLYGVENDRLIKLNTHYNIPYNTYSNAFSGISKSNLLKSIGELKLSYSSIKSYNECGFKYFIKNVLHLDIYEEKFPAFIGSLFHDALRVYRQNNFDMEYEWNKYIENSEYSLSLKDKMLLIRIKDDLVNLLEELRRQQLITGFNNDLCEKKFEVKLDSNEISVIFKGFIDKIMFIEKNGMTYFSIIDYKTGTIDTKIEPLKYGLNLQLPSYLYLIKNTDIIKNPKFGGLYFQNILFNYPSCKDMVEYDKETKNRLKLQGYSTDNEEVLEVFDSTYQKSELIKGMSLKNDGSFSAFANVISDEVVDLIVDYTGREINRAKDNILSGKFNIDPKNLAGKDVACQFCSFKDLCYKRETDTKYLSKVEDLSFLGGDF